MIDQYLVDRGINESLAEFVAMYIEFKEAREYQRWLGSKSLFTNACCSCLNANVLHRCEVIL